MVTPPWPAGERPEAPVTGSPSRHARPGRQAAARASGSLCAARCIRCRSRPGPAEDPPGKSVAPRGLAYL